MDLDLKQVARESHRSDRIGWLRAAVLGANDGIVSTASLIVGVAASHANPQNIAIAGVSGLVAGAMSMAAGEYVSVSSQADTEKADLEKEKEELSFSPQRELLELAKIYEDRGVDAGLSKVVAEQLMKKDALGAHARDELGISPSSLARPLQAALASAMAFSVGAALPLVLVFVVSEDRLMDGVFEISLISLFVLGSLASRVGGATIWRGAIRVTLWGALAMIVTAGIGALFGSVP
ncbi:MAG: VIT family protein [Pseudomonadota bacterium]